MLGQCIIWLVVRDKSVVFPVEIAVVVDEKRDLQFQNIDRDMYMGRRRRAMSRAKDIENIGSLIWQLTLQIQLPKEVLHNDE